MTRHERFIKCQASVKAPDDPTADATPLDVSHDRAMSGVSSGQGDSKSVDQVTRHQDKRQRYSSLTLPNQNIPVTAQETCCDHGLDTDMRTPSSRSESWVSNGVGASQGQPVPHSILKWTHGRPDTKHRITPRFLDIIELIGNSRVQIIQDVREAC